MSKFRGWKMLALAGAMLAGLDLSTVQQSAGRRAQVLPAQNNVPAEATVAIACSACSQLAQPAPRDATLSYGQVDAIVKQALRLDDSERSLARVVGPGDWVAIKVNIVTMPLVVKNRKLTSFWDQGVAHWGQATDLRVVKSLIDYLVNEEKDARRITIVEGGAEWSRVGEAGAATGQTEDGWTIHWAAFDSLSYTDIASQYNGVNGIEVDIVDLNYDDWVGTGGVRAGEPLPVPDPNQTGITWYQRPEGYYVSKTLLSVDKLVNVAAMKTHDIPGITLLHKQYVGTFMQRAYGERSNSKMGLHAYGNENVLRGVVDLFSYRPTDYGILESFWGTEGRGPQWGKNVQHNVVIAGGDPVAVDAVGAVAMGYNPADLEFLHLSAAKGFGTFDLDHIRVAGDPLPEVARDFEKPPSAAFWGWGNREWLVNGPHPGGVGLDQAGLSPAEGQLSGGITWKRWTGAGRRVLLPQDYVDAQSATYTFAYIDSREAQEGFLYLGAGEEVAVWLNGEEVLARQQVGQQPDAAQIPVALHQGLNPVLVEVWNTLGDAGLSLVAGDRDGDTLPGIRYVLDTPATAVEEEAGAAPERFELGNNYPNPFNPTTTIPYDLPRAGRAELAIYDARGARVRTLVDRSLPGGPHQSSWDGCDGQGLPVASGVYFYRLAIPGAQRVGRMLLVR
ncbi:MAG: DUF362 domain-containing protein [Candidatus Latescibacteria bacterium]|nr:DUF362 domain-containing protein [Candidatus Latescibacterota bacterium]